VISELDRLKECDQMRHPVVFACDEGYAMPLATTLRSIVEANQANGPLDCYILTDGFSEAAKRRVEESLPAGAAAIRWVPVDLQPFEGLSTLPHISGVTYARLLVAQILPEEVTRVLYLDADILVLKPLDQLWKTDLEGAVVGAVEDGLDRDLQSGKAGLDMVPRVRSYFNAGVLLIDLELWRKHRISERAFSFLERNPTSPFSDQDALNVVFDGCWKRLDAQWNFQSHHETALQGMLPGRRPGIVHFVTSSKPWDPRAWSVNASFYDEFRSRTRFARTRGECIGDYVVGNCYRACRFGRRAFRACIWHGRVERA
jgi:lipopolysaccharide biosynthesis glycosyltransferase